MATTKKAKKKTDAELLDDATRNLLRAVKAKASANGKPLRQSDLLKQGYSERFISQVEEA